MFYQPIVSAQTGKITGAEALVRWFSSELGLVSPVKFIPIAGHLAVGEGQVQVHPMPVPRLVIVEAGPRAGGEQFFAHA